MLFLSFFRFVTIHAFVRRTDAQTDRRTDRILIARPHLHCTQRGKNPTWRRPPSWICNTESIHEAALVVRKSAENLYVNRLTSFRDVDFSLQSFMLENAYSRPFWGVFGG